MPKYRHTYPYARHFPTLGLLVEPDEVIERDENPDPNFFEEVVAEKAAPPAAPEQPAAPAAAIPDESPDKEN